MYQAHFGLKKNLFDGGIAQDAAVFLGTPQKSVAANFAVALTTADSAVVLTGVAGVGKTTLTSAALRTVSTRVALGWLNGTPANGGELLELLLSEFGFNAHRAGRVERMQMWRQFLNEMNATDSRVFVIAERADDLAPEVLRAVESLTAADPNGCLGANLVLLGQPAFNETLKSPVLDGLRQRVRLRQRLEPLRVGELRDYLSQHVTLAGGTFDKVFAAGAVEAVHRCSNGVPRLANNVCETALTLAATEGLPSITAELVARVADLFGMEATPEAASAPTIADVAPPSASPSAPTSATTSAPTSASPAPPPSTRVAFAKTAAATLLSTPVAFAPMHPTTLSAPTAFVPAAIAAPLASLALTPLSSQSVNRSAPPPPAPASVAIDAPLGDHVQTTMTPAALSSPVPSAAPTAPIGATVARSLATESLVAKPSFVATTLPPPPAAPVSRPPVAAVAPVVSAAAPVATAASPFAAPRSPIAAAASDDSEDPAAITRNDDSFTITTVDTPDVASIDFPVLTDAVDPPDFSATATAVEEEDPSIAALARQSLTPPASRTKVAEPAPTPAPTVAYRPIAPPPAPAASQPAPPTRAATPAPPAPRIPSPIPPAAAPAPRASVATPQKPPVTAKPVAPLQEPEEDDAEELLHQTQTMRALATAKSIDDISSSMAETLFGEADLDMLSAALASAGWSEEEQPEPSAAKPRAKPAAPKASTPEPTSDPFDFFNLGPDAPLELIDDPEPPTDRARIGGKR